MTWLTSFFYVQHNHKNMTWQIPSVQITIHSKCFLVTDVYLFWPFCDSWWWVYRHYFQMLCPLCCYTLIGCYLLKLFYYVCSAYSQTVKMNSWKLEKDHVVFNGPFLCVNDIEASLVIVLWSSSCRSSHAFAPFWVKSRDCCVWKSQEISSL